MSDPSDKAFDILDNWYENAIKNGRGFKNEKERDDYIKSIGDPCKHPLFAETTDDLEGHPLTEAFRCIREEDKTLVELSIMYKDEGNEWLKKNTKKDYLEAIKRYSHALIFLDKADKARFDGTECIQDSSVDLNKLRSQILCNRALVHLNINNLGSCCKDSTIAIDLWPLNIKAHYRKSKALYKLKKFQDCILACTKGIKYDSNNKELFKIKEQCEQEIISQNNKKNEVNQRIISELILKWTNTWDISCIQKISLGYPFYSIPEPKELRDCWIHKDTTSSTINNQEIFKLPVLLQYPQYGTYDILASVGFDDMLVEQLCIVFPEKGDYEERIPWDVEEEYQVSNLAVYIQLQATKLILTKEEWLHACMEYYILMQSGSIKLLSYYYNQNGETNHSESINFETLKNKVDKREKIFIDYLIKCNSDNNNNNNNNNNNAIQFVEVHLGCTFIKILIAFYPLHVLSRGILKLIIYPKECRLHKLFKKQNIDNITYLFPS